MPRGRSTSADRSVAGLVSRSTMITFVRFLRVGDIVDIEWRIVPLDENIENSRKNSRKIVGKKYWTENGRNPNRQYFLPIFCTLLTSRFQLCLPHSSSMWIYPSSMRFPLFFSFPSGYPSSMNEIV
jgi:hypothetical protein